MTTLYCGIDPGGKGGICLLDEHGAVVDLSPMPATEKDVVDLLREFAGQIRMCVIEHVGVMPKQGISSAGKFMRHYGLLRGVLLALEIRFDEVRPQEWQRAMGITARGAKTKTEHKNTLKSKAQQLFPHQRITLATCDAVLLAEYCRRLRVVA